MEINIPEKSTKQKIGEKIRQVRKYKNIKQKCLAKELGIARAHLCKLERGRGYPSIQILEKIADYFEIELEYFFSDSCADCIFGDIKKHIENFVPPGRQ